jgi:hypothetical protein
MKEKKPIALYVVSIIAILMCVGYLYISKEMNVMDVLGAPEGEILSIVPVVQHLTDDTGYVMGELSDDHAPERFSQLLDLLDQCVFSPTPRNLLPFRENFLVDAEAEFIFDCAFTIQVNGQKKIMHMRWYGRNEAGVRADSSDGWYLYHPTSPEMLPALYNYMAEHGSPI